MKVITSYPVIHVTSRAKKNCPEFLSMDASSSTSQVKAFQDWLDVKYPTWYMGKKLSKASGYGVFGPITKAAYGRYGKEFDKGAQDLLGMFTNPFAPKTPSPTPASNTITNPATGVTTQVPDNTLNNTPTAQTNTPIRHGWSTLTKPQKITIIAGSGLIGVVLLYAIFKKK